VKAFVVGYPSASTQPIQDFYDKHETTKAYYDTWLAKAKEGDADAMARIQAAGGPIMFVFLENVEATGNYRNGLSVVGLDRGTIVGGLFNSNNNTTNDGPQCGIDLEPDAAASANTNIGLFGVTASSNGGTLSTGGGSGICVFGTAANTTNFDRLWTER
jgi:hypothetical protein